MACAHAKRNFKTSISQKNETYFIARGKKREKEEERLKYEEERLLYETYFIFSFRRFQFSRENKKNAMDTYTWVQSRHESSRLRNLFTLNFEPESNWEGKFR